MTTDGSERGRWSARTVDAGPPVEVDATTAVANTLPSPSAAGSAPAEHSVFDPPSERYAKVGELGRGGMGVVMEARDRALDRPVAIKYMHALSTVELARFEREARITAQLQHPSVVPIFDTGRDATGNPFYVMRKIEGDALSLRVRRATSVRERIALVPELLGAIDAAAYAHARGVVHRDIKPWNILLGPFGESLLIDWGIAAHQADVEVGSTMGTPGFMPPEQARGERVDARADVYALGATLFFVLAGKMPFSTMPPTAVLAAVSEGTLPDVAEIPSEVPAELVTITMKSLASERTARYATAGELAGDLRRFLAGQLVAAHVYTPLARVARWIRRHRVITAVSAVALAAVATMGGLSVLRVTRERDRADAARALAEQRADERIVDRARNLAETDPTSAIAVLRDLPPKSSQWDSARTVVQAAVASGGITRAIHTAHGYVTALAISTDGLIASAGSDATVEIHRRDGTLVRTLGHAATALEWLDAKTLVMHVAADSTEHLALADTTTGVLRELPDAVKAAVADAGVLVLLDPAGAVATLAADGTRTPLVDGGARAIDARGGRIAIASPDRLLVIGADHVRTEQPLAFPTAIFAVRIADTGTSVGLLTFGAIHRVLVGAAAPPADWPATREVLNGLTYAGDALYAWSNDGTGVRALGGRLDVPHFTVESQGLMASARYQGGAVFATTTGRLAYADERGFIEVPRRASRITAVAAHPAGSWTVAGTPTGDLLVVDLDATRPRVLATKPALRLYGIEHGTVLVGEGRPDGTVALQTIAATGASPGRLATVSADEQVMTIGGLLVAQATDGAVRAWDVKGTPWPAIPPAVAFAIGTTRQGTTSVLYATDAGDVFEQAATGAPTRLAQFGTHDNGGTTVSRVAQLDLDESTHALVAMVYQDGATAYRYVLLDETGSHDLPIHVDGWVAVEGRTRDGAWWMVADYTRLLRMPPGGPPAPVELPEQIQRTRIVDGRVLAFGETTIYVLEPSGALVTTIAVDSQGSQVCGHDVAWRSDSAVLVANPALGARRRYALSPWAQQFRCSDDGTITAAIVPLDSGLQELVTWIDPVPATAALQPYLATLTNARLRPGFDAIAWE